MENPNENKESCHNLWDCGSGAVCNQHSLFKTTPNAGTADYDGGISVSGCRSGFADLPSTVCRERKK